MPASSSMEAPAGPAPPQALGMTMVSQFVSLSMPRGESEAGEQKQACLSHVPPCPNKQCKGRTNQLVDTMPAASRPDTPQSSFQLRSPGRQHNKANSNATSSPSRGPSPGRDANLRQDVRPPIDPLSQARTSVQLPHKCKDLSTDPSLSHSKSYDAQLAPSNYPMLCDREVRAAHTLCKTMRRASMLPCLCKHPHPEPTPTRLRART